MDKNSLIDALSYIKDLEKPPRGYSMSPTMLNSIKEQSPPLYQRETQNINQSFYGFEIKEDALMPDNMMVAYDDRSQIIGAIKIENGEMTYSKIEPKDFYIDLTKISELTKEQPHD